MEIHVFMDATNPAYKRIRLGEMSRKTITTMGIQMFWLDEAEPEFTAYDFENYRYFAGTGRRGRKYLSA